MRSLSSSLLFALAVLGVGCASSGGSASPDGGSCPGSSSYACRDGECIPRAQRCDGMRQCNDGSDESGCSVDAGYAPPPPPPPDARPMSDARPPMADARTDQPRPDAGGSGSGGCGSITWEGGCDGDVVYWCEGEGSGAHVERADCYPDVCGWTGSYYDCLPYEDSCESAYDGWCDEPVWCDYGTDQSDCYWYGNNCGWAFDGECDEPILCWYGTDNYDCNWGYY
jgi:hypothetical protein